MFQHFFSNNFFIPIFFNVFLNSSTDPGLAYWPSLVQFFSFWSTKIQWTFFKCVSLNEYIIYVQVWKGQLSPSEPEGRIRQIHECPRVARNLGPVTFQMLWPSATTNCGALRPLIASLWLQKCRSLRPQRTVAAKGCKWLIYDINLATKWPIWLSWALVPYRMK